MKKETLEKIFIYTLSSIVMSIVAWCFIVASHFGLHQPYYKGLFKALFLIPKHSTLVWITVGSVALGFSISALLWWLYENYSVGTFGSRNHIRGSQIVNARQLKQRTSNKKEKQITIAQVPIPERIETLHFLIGGRTGTGKTVAIKEMLKGILARGDRVILADPNGAFLSHFF